MKIVVIERMDKAIWVKFNDSKSFYTVKESLVNRAIQIFVDDTEIDSIRLDSGVLIEIISKAEVLYPNNTIMDVKDAYDTYKTETK